MLLALDPRLKEANRRTGYLEDSAYQDLVQGSELWFRTLVECGRTYGWRSSELVNLKVNQVNLVDRVIRLDTSKNGDPREAAMTNPVYLLLSECIFGKSGDQHVFTRPDGKRVRDFRQTWWNACVRAGLGRMVCRTCSARSADGRHCDQCKREGRKGDDLRYVGLFFHDLRRTAARNMRRAGIPESLIMDIGGWRTASVFRRYAIVNRNDHRDAMRKLEASQQPAPEFGHNLGTTAHFPVQLQRPS